MPRTPEEQKILDERDRKRVEAKAAAMKRY
jgi:hypothetical protein